MRQIGSHPDKTWIMKNAQTEPRFAEAVAS